MSVCPSSGGKYQTCGQSQKMSIGMFVEADVSIKRMNEASNTEHSMKKHIERRVKASISSTMCNNDFQEDSLRGITGSRAANMLLKDSKHSDGHGSRPADTFGMESRKVFMYEQQFQNEPKEQVCFPFREEPSVCKEALRIKLREILGTRSSNEKISGIRTHEEKDEASLREQTLKDEKSFKTRQSSDTIEDDSENVDSTIKKPVTRSLSRKRAIARSRPNNFKAKQVSCDKKGEQGSDIFSFAQKSAPSPPCTENRNSLMADKKSGGKTSPISDPRSKIRCEKEQKVEELPLSGGVASPNHDCLDKNQPENFHHSPVTREINNFPEEKYENFEPFGGHSPVNYVDDLNYQWLKVTKVKSGSPMGSDLPTNNKKENVQVERGVVNEAQCLLKNNTTSEKEISEFSDDDCDLEYSQTSNSTSSKEENDGLFIPVREELEEISIAKKVCQDVKDVCTSPEISSLGKSTLFRSKRHGYHGVDLNDLSPTLHAPKASENADDVSMSLDDIPETGLARVASILGVALEKIKNKMVLLRNKKCSEIIVSTAQEINLQLSSVQSQIQSDLEKLSSLKSSKRKRSETRLQEQQGQLKVMHEKFKEEISKYIDGCKGAMEGLESQHIELQGVIEKQKAMHKKLLLQTEAAVETRLLEAHKEMMLVRKLEKKKMQMLKLTIAQCLNDTVDQ